MSVRPKSRKILGISAFILAMAAFVGLFFWARQATYFAIQEIQIELPKSPFVKKKDILALTGVPLGQNLFSLDLKKIERQLEADPWVARAFVSRRLPNTLFIKVRLQEPVAMVATSSGVYLVNKEGRLFAPATKEMLKDFPAIVGLSPEEKEARMLSPQVRPLLALLAYLRRTDQLVPCYANISQIKILDDGFLLITRDALTVRFPSGDLKTLLAKYRRLDRIFQYLYETRQYARTKLIRLDYPDGEAALLLKEG